MDNGGGGMPIKDLHGGAKSHINLWIHFGHRQYQDTIVIVE